MGRRRSIVKELVRRGLVADSQEALIKIRDHRVLVNGATAFSDRASVLPGDDIKMTPAEKEFVSRGGIKLKGALKRFQISPKDKNCLDVGSSTGGFIDCLLQNGAKTVTGVDTGKGILHIRLANDCRVEMLEQYNMRHAKQEDFLYRPFAIITIDVSFTSVDAVLAASQDSADDDCDLFVLIKPQFECTREEADCNGGIISNPTIWRRILNEKVASFTRTNLTLMQLMPSPITGTKGNVEFFAHVQKGLKSPSADAMINDVIEEVCK